MTLLNENREDRPERHSEYWGDRYNWRRCTERGREIDRALQNSNIDKFNKDRCISLIVDNTTLKTNYTKDEVMQWFADAEQAIKDAGGLEQLKLELQTLREECRSRLINDVYKALGIENNPKREVLLNIVSPYALDNFGAGHSCYNGFVCSYFFKRMEELVDLIK